MNKSRVAVIRCQEYEDDLVYTAVQKGIELLGGVSVFVRAKEKIVLKPNVLIGTDPKKSVTTHPAVFKAISKLLLDSGIDVFYGDSSGIGKCESNMAKAKLKPIADEMGIKLADFDQGTSVSHKFALLVKQLTIVNGVLSADGLISLPKLKTHGLTRLTGAIKNQFGCIPGLQKSQFHFRLPDTYDFATMLVDINTYIKPRLYIMDGIIGMEGNGPRNGKPRQLNVLLFSSDPVALDAVACKIINLDPEIVPTSQPGEKAGLGTYHFDEIELLGDDINSFIVRDFAVVRQAPVHTSSGRLRKFFNNQLSPRPAIDKTKCNGCGTCLDVCPSNPKSIYRLADSKSVPEYIYNNCLRCFCCQEMCPQGAITIENPPLSKLMTR